MAYGIDEFGNDQAPAGWNPGPGTIGQPPGAVGRDDAAKNFARRRLLMALAGGLSAPNQGGGFLGGLSAGLAGSVGAGENFTQKRHEQMRQEQRDEAEARRQEFRDSLDQERLGLERKRVGYEEQRLNRQEGPNVAPIPWYEALPDDDPRKGLYRQDATRQPVGRAPSLFDRWLNAKTPEERAQIKEFMRLGKGGSEPEELGTEMEYFDAAGNPVGQFDAVSSRRSKIFSNTPGVSYSTGGKLQPPPKKGKKTADPGGLR